jgi:hypothetical protein
MDPRAPLNCISAFRTFDPSRASTAPHRNSVYFSMMPQPRSCSRGEDALVPKVCVHTWALARPHFAQMSPSDCRRQVLDGGRICRTVAEACNLCATHPLHGNSRQEGWPLGRWESGAWRCSASMHITVSPFSSDFYIVHYVLCIMVVSGGGGAALLASSSGRVGWRVPGGSAGACSRVHGIAVARRSCTGVLVGSVCALCVKSTP